VSACRLQVFGKLQRELGILATVAEERSMDFVDHSAIGGRSAIQEYRTPSCHIVSRIWILSDNFRCSGLCSSRNCLSESQGYVTPCQRASTVEQVRTNGPPQSGRMSISGVTVYQEGEYNIDRK